MNEKITLISVFNKENLAKITNILKEINEPMCRVPYGRNVKSRFLVDNLPYHFTLSSWNIIEEKYIIEKLSHLKLKPLKIKINNIEIMSGKENSYVLYFNIEENNELKILQKEVYNFLPNKIYNPDFKFHITIAIDKDYEKIIRIKNELTKYFRPFDLELNKIGLYEIYPANLVTTVELNQ